MMLQWVPMLDVWSANCINYINKTLNERKYLLTENRSTSIRRYSFYNLEDIVLRFTPVLSLDLILLLLTVVKVFHVCFYMLLQIMTRLYGFQGHLLPDRWHLELSPDITLEMLTEAWVGRTSGKKKLQSMFYRCGLTDIELVIFDKLNMMCAVAKMN